MQSKIFIFDVLSCTLPSFYSRSILYYLFILQQHCSMLVDSTLSAAQQRHPNTYQTQYLQKYQPEFKQTEWQTAHDENHKNANPNNDNNNIYHRNKQAATNRGHYYKQPSSVSYDQQNQRPISRIPNISLAERNQHKCPIWVPMEAFHKYPWAGNIQVDQSKQMELIEICCPGFGPVRWRGSTLCRPLCKCQNGLCLAPGVCKCYDEFVKNDNGDCVFTCPMGCLNGRCFLDGSCQCDPGYKLDETRKFCRPICSAGCGQSSRHNCTEPEVCGCTTGYRLTDNGCQPTCTPECGAGGLCREYNMCECRLGYTLKNGSCQSECYQKCDNGICYGHNRCICNKGFTYHEKSTQCIPV